MERKTGLSRRRRYFSDIDTRRDDLPRLAIERLGSYSMKLDRVNPCPVGPTRLPHPRPASASTTEPGRGFLFLAPSGQARAKCQLLFSSCTFLASRLVKLLWFWLFLLL